MKPKCGERECDECESSWPPPSIAVTKSIFTTTTQIRTPKILLYAVSVRRSRASLYLHSKGVGMQEKSVPLLLRCTIQSIPYQKHNPPTQLDHEHAIVKEGRDEEERGWAVQNARANCLAERMYKHKMARQVANNTSQSLKVLTQALVQGRKAAPHRASLKGKRRPAVM